MRKWCVHVKKHRKERPIAILQLLQYIHECALMNVYMCVCVCVLFE